MQPTAPLLLGIVLAAALALAVPACSSPGESAPAHTSPAASGLPAEEIAHLGEEAGIHGTLGSGGAAADPTPVFAFAPQKNATGGSGIGNLTANTHAATTVID